MATAVTTFRSTEGCNSWLQLLQQYTLHRIPSLHQRYKWQHFNTPRSKTLILAHSYIEVDPKFHFAWASSFVHLQVI